MANGAGGGPHAVTVPGFSSRSQVQVFSQFPQKDAHMSDMQPEAGFSNSEPVEDAPQDVYADVQPPEEPEPGFSNSKAVKADDPAAAESDDSDADEAPAKKAAAKKTAKKKG